MKIKLNVDTIGIYAIFLILMEPPIFFHYKIHYIYKISQYLLFGFSFILLVFRKKYTNNKFVLFVIIYSFFSFLITLMNNFDYVFKYQYDLLYLICFIVFCSYYAFYDLEKFIHIITKIFVVYTFFNAVSYFIYYPVGIIYTQSTNGLMENYYFLGMDNQFSKYIIPMLILIVLNAIIQKNKGTNYFYGLNILINALLVVHTWSVTAIISFFSFLFIVFFYLINRIKYNKKLFVIIYFIVFIIIILLPNLNIDFINDLIVNVFGKTLTFSGRTDIWLQTIQKIIQSPLLGYGNVPGRVAIETHSGLMLSSHNLLLQLLLENGLLGIIPIFSCFYLSLKSSFCDNDKFVVVGYIGIFSLMVSMLMEVYQIEFLLMILLLIYIYKYKNKKYVYLEQTKYN